MVDETLVSRSPFMNLIAASGSGNGVTATDRDGLGLATVMVRRGRLEALRRRLRERYAIELPSGNYREEAQGVAFAGVGPETWFAASENGGNEFAASLREELGVLASVSDQTDGYGVLRLSGPRVRDALAKLVPIDLHPRSFKTGGVVSTVASHVGVTLWRMNDSADGAPVFELAVFRSLAASFWHAFAQSAAEFGVMVGEKQFPPTRGGWSA